MTFYSSHAEKKQPFLVIAGFNFPSILILFGFARHQHSVRPLIRKPAKTAHSKISSIIHGYATNMMNYT